METREALEALKTAVVRASEEASKLPNHGFLADYVLLVHWPTLVDVFEHEMNKEVR